MSETKSFSQMRKDFHNKYETKIVPKIKHLDNKRKLRLFFAVLGSSVLFLLGVWLILCTKFDLDISADPDATSSLVKMALFLFFVSFLYWSIIKKGFENNIKKRVMPIVCSCFDDLRWSNGDYNLNEKIFAHSYLIPDFSSSSYDDIFNGKYKDVKFEVIESEFIRGFGKNRTTVFKGVIIKLDMNKRFTGHTVIKPVSLLHLSPGKELRHTVLEDVKFEKKFDVFTDDEVDARYLITPSFMERLYNMKVAFSADNVSCSFYGNILLLALHSNKDLFSLCSLLKPIDDSKQYFKMYEEIVSIIKLIDHFKLDQKIGL
jgi:hypothetical protein